MKARLPQRSKGKRRLRVAFLALGVVCVGWLLPQAVSLLSAIVLYPVQQTRDWLRTSSDFIPTLFRERSELRDEIADLKQQLRVAQGSQLSFDRLREENQQLRNMLGAGETERIAASIIARPNELPYDLVQIDRGMKHEVEVGAPVFLGQDVVIGLVVHVAPEYSFVEMISSPGFSATAFVSGANVVSPIEGMGGGVARVRVPQGLLLRVGDIVFLPSVEPGVYGKIAYLENEPTQPEQYGYITPEVPLSGLRLVSVGRLSQISKSPKQIEERIREDAKRVLELTGFTPSEVAMLVASSTGTSTGSSTELVQ